MTTPILPQTEQTDKAALIAATATLTRLQANSLARRRKAVIAEWIAVTLDTIEALREFYHRLQVWQLRPDYTVDEDVFLSTVQDLADAGLLDWLDGSPQDATGPRPKVDDLARVLGLNLEEK